MEEHQKLPKVAIFPSLGIGHIIPLIQFSKFLVSHFNFSVSLFLPPTQHQPDPAHLSPLHNLPNSISYSFLPPVNPAHLPENQTLSSIISHTNIHSLSSVRAVLGSLTQHSRVVALITDIFGSDLFDLAREFTIPPYLFFTSNVMCLLFAYHLPKLDKNVFCEYRDMPGPLGLPGCVPIYGVDFPEASQNRKSEGYKIMLHHTERYKLAEGIFVNSFIDLESDALRVFQNEISDWPRVYPIGPIIQSGFGSDEYKWECLSWLDQQPIGSVLFVSFGSGGTLSYEQTIELAIGLEKCGQNFLWVVRDPNNSVSGSFFGQCNDDESFGYLPEGYLDRIKGRGFLVPSWAPQVKILSHKSIGGFVSHCGWNSVLESIVYGVPLIAWPLYAEQKMNAVLVSEGLKVALRVKANENGVVEVDEIARIVKDLMEGEEGNKAREKMKVLSELAKKAMGEDGDAMKTLSQVTKIWSACS